MPAKRKAECPPGMDYVDWHNACVKKRKQAKEERKRIKLGLPPKKQAKPRTKPQTLPIGYQIDDTAMSFDEWKDCGRCVKKGSKSQLTDILGIPQFTLDQTQKINAAWASWRSKQ